MAKTKFPKADFNNKKYCLELKNLFHPGSGVIPPKLAGREKEEKIIAGFIESLENRYPIPRDIVIYGPRGNGKTALTRQTKKQCENTNIDCIFLTPSEIPDETALASKALYQDGAINQLIKKGIPRKAGIGIQGIFSTEWEQKTADEKDRHYARFFKEFLEQRCNNKPFILIVDEGHTLDKKVGQKLLDTSQQIRSGNAPFLLIIAGTPNLEAHLNDINATFWSRSKILPLGRINDEATRQAIAEPLNNLDITFDEDALDKIRSESQNYPYFTQVWGKALSDKLVEEKTTKVTPEIVTSIQNEIEEERNKYYKTRHTEMEKRDLLQAAAALGELFKDKPHVGNTRILETLQRFETPEKNKLQIREELSDLGYIWQPGQSTQQASDTDWEPGIPSLMTFINERERGKVTGRP